MEMFSGTSYFAGSTKEIQMGLLFVTSGILQANSGSLIHSLIFVCDKNFSYADLSLKKLHAEYSTTIFYILGRLFHISKIEIG